MFLKKQIVSGGYVIVFIRLETLPSIFDVNVVWGQALQNFRVYRDLVNANYSTLEIFFTFDKAEPRVFSYVFYFISFFRVCI